MNRKRALWLAILASALAWSGSVEAVLSQDASSPAGSRAEKRQTSMIEGRAALRRAEPELRRGLFEAWKERHRKDRASLSPQDAKALLAVSAVGRASMVINSSGTIFYTRQMPGGSCDTDQHACGGGGNVNCPSWGVDTSYNAGDVVEASAFGNEIYYGLLFQAQNGGLSGLNEPSWPILAGGTVNDNGITWKAIGFAPSTLVGCTAMQIVSRTSGGVETVLVSEGDFLSDGTQVSGWGEFLAANDSGQVAFKAEQVGRPNEGDEGGAVIMLAGPGPGTLTRIADSPTTIGGHDIFGYSSMVGMNNAGQVVFDGLGPFSFGSTKGLATAMWAASTNYGSGARVIPTSNVPLLRFYAILGGTSGASEPVWPNVVGQTVVDGSVTWKAALTDADEDNHTLIRYTPGVGNEELLGQGDFVPPDFAVDGFGQDDNSGPNCSGSCVYDNFDGFINSSGHVPVVITSNGGQFVYLLKGPGVNTIAASSGSPGPGGKNFGTIFPRIAINDSDQLVFLADVVGVKTLKTLVRWTPPSTFAVIAAVEDDIGIRSGGAASGVTISDIGYFADINNPGNVVFQATLAGGPSPLGFFFWDGSTGLLSTVTTGAAFPPAGTCPGNSPGFFGLASEMITLNNSNLVAFVNGSCVPEQISEASEDVEKGLYFWTKAGGAVKAIASGDPISGNTVTNVYGQHTSFVKRNLNSSGCAAIRYFVSVPGGPNQRGDSDEEEGSGPAPSFAGTPPGGQLFTSCGVVCPTITVSPASLPGGTQGAAYSQTITASGGASPYTFTVTAGSLPIGFTLSSGGLLSGTTFYPGTYNFTITATDANSCTGSRAYTLVIIPSGGCQPPPAPVLTVSPSNATLGDQIILTWNATIASGQGSYEVEVSSNGNPYAIVATIAASSSSTVKFKYVPSAPGTYSFRVLAVPSCNPQLFSTSNTGGATVTGPCANAPLVTGVTVSPTEAVVGASFTVSWNPVSGSVVYGVFQSTDGGQTFKQIGSTSGTSFMGTVTGQPGGTLTFEVEVLGCVYSQRSNFAKLLIQTLVCDPPGAVTNVQVQAFGVTPSRPPSPTEYIQVSWTPPATGTAPTRYGVRINGDPEVLVVGTSVVLPPRGTPDPITAFVTAYGCAALTSAELYDPLLGGWTATGNPVLPRQAHTATALSSGGGATALSFGKVLVAGGSTNLFTSPTPTSELYDPVLASWSTTGVLSTPRDLHAATLLNDSHVLVEGGFGTQPLSSSELYDPVSGTWSAAGSLATARDLHTATLLNNGKVLVVGGLGSGPLSSSELYDPATRTWTATGTLGTARYRHTATLLSNGKVLVAGGLGAAGALSSAELYDPVAGTWSSTGALVNAREAHTATLLASGSVLVASGDDGSSLISTAEIYDPAAGTWTRTGDVIAARRGHTATLLGIGKVLIVGGFGTALDKSLKSAELWDPATGAFSATGSLAGSHGAHTATLLSNSKVLVAGAADTLGQEKAGTTASSGVVALFLTPPVASFTVSANPRVGVPVTFTDTSSPQATSWLWIFDDGTTDLRQSPSHTFTTAGTHSVSLVATNSAGSSTATQSFTVAAAGTSVAPILPSATISFDTADPSRQRARIELAGRDTRFLRIRSLESVETIVFLRFLDTGGGLVTERRLSIPAGAETVYDLGAWGRTGQFTIVLVSNQRFEAKVSVIGRPGSREVVR